MNGDTWIFLALCGALLVFLLMASFLSKSYSLNNIKSKTVGDGQHGTARWATPKEIGKTYHTVPFRPRRWRKGKELPTEQGLILGSVGGGKRKSKAGILLKTSRKLLEKLRRPVAGKQKRKPKKKSKALSKVKKMIEEQGDIRALEIPEVCCGQHETCERDSLLAAVSKKIEYYNDEELDRFQGVEADAYDEEAVEEFSEVLYTLREVEVAGWLRSLQLRGINLPDALKDEAFLIIGERRTH
jgi:hypothetical protein